MNNIIIGVDFDNTIVDYDELMHGLALEEGVINKDVSVNKQKIRDAIRSLNDGEIKWQKLQAKVYGRFMLQAKLIEGVREFFSSCHQQETPIFIISHKTQFAAKDEEKVDLHKAALKWMEEKDFFEKVFFEPTRQKKIERIVSLSCTHFIDDLAETFLETSFPKGVQKILYAPGMSSKIKDDILAVPSWEKIYDCFFANIRK